jgi:hypothetical protein
VEFNKVVLTPRFAKAEVIIDFVEGEVFEVGSFNIVRD